MKFKDKRNLYVLVKKKISKGISVEEACIGLENRFKTPPDQLLEYYLEFEDWVTVAQEIMKDTIPTLRSKIEKRAAEVKDVDAPTKKKFEDWEVECIAVGLVANPMMSKIGYIDCLTELFYYRTSRSFQSFVSRKENTELESVFKRAYDNYREEHKPLDGNPLVEGEIVDCTVIRLKDYGAILVTDLGPRGLLHISEIRDHHIRNIGDYLQEGQRIKAKVRYDNQGRLGFSIKDLSISHEVLDVKPIEPVVMRIVDKIPAQLPQKPQRVEVKLSELSFNNLPTALTNLLTGLEKDRGLLDQRIETIKLVLATIEKEQKAFEKLHELKKHLANI